MNMPETHTFTAKRAGTTVFTDIGAQCLPARRDISAFYGVPSTKMYEVLCNGVFALQEQDQLVSQLDATETYRVLGVATFKTIRLPHTELDVERVWGVA